jgi:preprotein translocase subunit YajC
VIENYWLNALYSLIPTVFLGFIFWFIMRAIIHSDRNERKAYSKMEAQERAKLAAAKQSQA